MGYFGKVKQREEAVQLRKKGLSLRRIEQMLQVSRSSVSLWTRGIELTKKQLHQLQLNKEFGQKKGSQIAANRKTQSRLDTTIKLLEEGKREIQFISKRDRFIFGVGLYFAEGNKSDKAIGFTNSDPRSIKFMINWFREFCDIDYQEFRCNLYLHDTINENDAKEYWSRITGVPLSQFKKSYIVKNNPDRLKRTKYEYGICRINVGNVNKLRKIMGWISGVFSV